MPEPLGKNVYRTADGNYHFLHNPMLTYSRLPGFLIVTPSDLDIDKQVKIAGHFQTRIHSFDQGVVGYLTGGGPEPVNKLTTRAIDLHQRLEVKSRRRPYFDVAYYLDRDSEDPTQIRAAIVSTRGYRSEATDIIVYGSGRPVIAVVGRVVDRKGTEGIERNVVVKADDLDILQSELGAAIGDQLRRAETMFFYDSENGEFSMVKSIKPAQGLGLDRLISTS